jgi:hypothetical protein
MSCNEQVHTGSCIVLELLGGITAISAVSGIQLR